MLQDDADMLTATTLLTNNMHFQATFSREMLSSQMLCELVRCHDVEVVS